MSEVLGVLGRYPILMDIMSDSHFELVKNSKMLKMLDRYWKTETSFFNVRCKKNGNENIDEHYRVLAACGDICCIDQMTVYLDKVSSLYDYVLFVPGNHEYYGQEMLSINRELDSIHDNYSNVHIFTPSNERLLLREDLLIHGSTLWADVYEGCRVNSEKTPISIDDRLLAYSDMNQLYDYSVQRLNGTIDIARRRSLDTVVLTHHAPSLTVKNIYHSNDHCGYVSDLSYLIADPIIAWVYGHTHLNITSTVNDVLITSSQWGSPKNIVKNGLIL